MVHGIPWIYCVGFQHNPLLVPTWARTLAAIYGWTRRAFWLTSSCRVFYEALMDFVEMTHTCPTHCVVFVQGIPPPQPYLVNLQYQAWNGIYQCQGIHSLHSTVNRHASQKAIARPGKARQFAPQRMLANIARLQHACVQTCARGRHYSCSCHVLVPHLSPSLQQLSPHVSSDHAP